MWNVNNTFKVLKRHKPLSQYLDRTSHRILGLAYGSEGLFRKNRTSFVSYSEDCWKGGDSTPILAPLRCERSSNHIEEEDKRLMPSVGQFWRRRTPDRDRRYG